MLYALPKLSHEPTRWTAWTDGWVFVVLKASREIKKIELGKE
jgi:hypothetical protein